jgi:hypothetical protein
LCSSGDITVKYQYQVSQYKYSTHILSMELDTGTAVENRQ